MGIPTLISTNTASGDASVSITSGIDSTYDEYMFVYTDIDQSNDSSDFWFQCSTDSGSNYNITTTNTAFKVFHSEDDSQTGLTYGTAEDLAQSTSYTKLAYQLGNGADESAAGILHLFNPSSTTYVKHFYARTNYYEYTNDSREWYTAGYFNTTSAIDAIQFDVANGTFSGTIQMYGIS